MAIPVVQQMCVDAERSKSNSRLITLRLYPPSKEVAL